MDNLSVDVTSEGRVSLEHALALVFSRQREATHYLIANVKHDVRYYGRTCDEKDANFDHEGFPAKVHHCESSAIDATGTPSLILFWSEHEIATKLPFPLDMKKSVDFAANWLEQVAYGKQPDHDGDNGKGFRVFNEAWGHVLGHWQAFVAIQPVWAMYGK